MAIISTIRDAFKTRLETITGLRVPEVVPTTISPPPPPGATAVVTPGNPFVTFDSNFARGADDLRFNIRILVSNTTDRVAQDALDAYIDGSGTRSIKQVLEADPAGLNGAVQSLRVIGVTDYGLFTVGAVEYVSALFSVEVVAGGT